MKNHNSRKCTATNRKTFKLSSLLFPSLLLLAASLTSCGGGGGGSSSNALTQPQNVIATAGDAQVRISWDNVSTATAYDICTTTETITQPENCSSHAGGTLSIDQTSPALITGLDNSTTYFFVVIPKSTNGDGTASAVVSVILAGPAVTGELNDTGITLCGDYTFGSGGNDNNDLDCTLAVDGEGDPIPAGQDALFGRDADSSTNSDSDGHKGFSFTKLDSNGFALSDQSGTTFSCVKDNVTGLIWEVKQTAVGLHNKDDGYTWLNIDASTNGGGNGTVNANASCEDNTDTVCNTQAYVDRVNIARLCGDSSWRLPTREELRSLIHYDRNQPAIDTTYFPNVTNFYWSSSPSASNNNIALAMDFNNGNALDFSKSEVNSVRLVRNRSTRELILIP